MSDGIIKVLALVGIGDCKALCNADCSLRCRFQSHTALNDTFFLIDLILIVSHLKNKIPIASLKTTIQQLQLHPLHHRRKTRILMALLAVKSEARATLKMIYSRWIQTVSEK